jgi:hypothetical protein
VQAVEQQRRSDFAANQSYIDRNSDPDRRVSCAAELQRLSLGLNQVADGGLCILNRQLELLPQEEENRGCMAGLRVARPPDRGGRSRGRHPMAQIAFLVGAAVPAGSQSGAIDIRIAAFGHVRANLSVECHNEVIQNSDSCTVKKPRPRVALCRIHPFQLL